MGGSAHSSKLHSDHLFLLFPLLDLLWELEVEVGVVEFFVGKFILKSLLEQVSVVENDVSEFVKDLLAERFLGGNELADRLEGERAGSTV